MDNPYSQQGRPAPGPSYGGGNGGGGGYKGNGGGGYGGGGGGGYKGGGGGGGGNRFQQKPKTWTEDELRNAHFGVSVVMMGNENFPPDITNLVERIVRSLESKNVIIRAAPIRGLSKHIQSVIKNPELHIPFKNFDTIENPASYYTTEYCTALAKRFFPDMEKLPMVIKAIYSANPRLVFGKNLDRPVQLAIIWSDDGCQQPSEITLRSGFAGHVLKLCASAGIPVINMQKPDAEQRVMQFLESLYVEKQQAHTPPNAQEAIHSPNSNPGTYRGDYGTPNNTPQQQPYQRPTEGNGGDRPVHNGQQPNGPIPQGHGFNGQHPPSTGPQGNGGGEYLSGPQSNDRPIHNQQQSYPAQGNGGY